MVPAATDEFQSKRGAGAIRLACAGLPDLRRLLTLAGMSQSSGSGSTEFPRSRSARVALVLLGIVLCQFVLFGPSLVGKRILLPLDILATPTTYLPMTPEVEAITPHNPVLSDIVCQFEPQRRFAVAELRAGRFPFWSPYQYCGAPAVWPKFSVFQWIGFLTPSPVILAWVQLAEALVAGLGAYVFFRRVLGVSFWAAAFPAWCYPLTAFFIFWTGFPTSVAAYWLPWLLTAVNEVVCHPRPRALAGLAVATALVLTGGHLDVAGQVLLASGLFALWRWAELCAGEWLRGSGRRILVFLTLGWTAGFLLAAPHLLPLLEYVQTGARMVKRSAGKEERPPIGLVALPQLAMPLMHGSTETDSLPLFPKKQGTYVEGVSAGYAGVVALLLAAPLALAHRRHRTSAWCWLALGFVGLSWALNVPGFVQLLRLPGLNMMSHIRLVFWTAFAVLALAALGLDALRQGEVRWHRGFWLAAVLLAAVAVHAGTRAFTLPRDIEASKAALLEQGKTTGWIRDQAGVERVKAWFARTNGVAATLAMLGLGGWLLLWRKKLAPVTLAGAAGTVMVADLLAFGLGRVPQCDPKLDYPRLPVFDAIAKLPPGRILGYGCLTATVGQPSGFNDVRGYDSIDPGRLTELVLTTLDPRSPVFSYARLQRIVPRVELSPPDHLRLPPVLDLLNVRHVIFRGGPPSDIKPPFREDDYYLLENTNALPRVFVPRSVERVADDAERLRRMTAPDFDPRAVAFVEDAVDLPGPCEGHADIVSEIPTRVAVRANLPTPGMILLADTWDRGWRAYRSGARLPVLRADHALRGVMLPAGESLVEFRYEPASFRLGLWLCGGGVVLLALLHFTQRRA